MSKKFDTFHDNSARLIPLRIEFVSEKSRLTSGKKRTINFENGSSNQEAVSAPGFLKNELLVSVGQGMPNTSKPRRDAQIPGRKIIQNNNRNRENGKCRSTVSNISSFCIRALVWYRLNFWVYIEPPPSLIYISLILALMTTFASLASSQH